MAAGKSDRVEVGKTKARSRIDYKKIVAVAATLGEVLCDDLVLVVSGYMSALDQEPSQDA